MKFTKGHFYVYFNLNLRSYRQLFVLLITPLWKIALRWNRKEFFRLINPLLSTNYLERKFFYISQKTPSLRLSLRLSLCLYGNLWHPNCVDLSLTVSLLLLFSLYASLSFLNLSFSHPLSFSYSLNLYPSLSKQTFYYTVKCYEDVNFDKVKYDLKGHMRPLFKNFRSFDNLDLRSYQQPLSLSFLIFFHT